jgi:hypothetical protein
VHDEGRRPVKIVGNPTFSATDSTVGGEVVGLVGSPRAADVTAICEALA